MTEQDVLTYEVREYPLEVEHVASGGYFSKGWHDAREFADAVTWLHREEYDGEGYYEPHEVRYEVWRCVPAGPDDPYHMWFLPAQLGTHGAFPVTVVGD